MACECGCEVEGEDDVTQFCIEEAVMIVYDAVVNADLDADQNSAATGEMSFEEHRRVRDPAVADALEQAKRMHFEQFGVRV